MNPPEPLKESDRQSSAQPLLTIVNTHAANCGTPPSIDNMAAELYVGYFENIHGEQWIFTFNRKTRDATLRGGDIDWGNIQEVRAGRAEGLNLNAEEAAWLQACWKATGA